MVFCDRQFIIKSIYECCCFPPLLKEINKPNMMKVHKCYLGILVLVINRAATFMQMYANLSKYYSESKNFQKKKKKNHRFGVAKALKNY